MLRRKEIVMPKIPMQLFSNSSVAMVLCSTINEFNFEEQTAIYLYCADNFPVNKIVAMTELPTLYVASTLRMFAERLSFKLSVFERTIAADNCEKVPIKQLFELENVKIMREYEYFNKHIKWMAEIGNSDFVLNF